jgi:hypothetical protein
LGGFEVPLSPTGQFAINDLLDDSKNCLRNLSESV